MSFVLNHSGSYECFLQKKTVISSILMTFLFQIISHEKKAHDNWVSIKFS